MIVVNSTRYWLIGTAISIAIALILYFAVIKSNNDTANHALAVGEQQAQQAVQQANKATGGAVPASVTSLTSCLAAAGTDSGKIQACDAKFKPSSTTVNQALAAGEKQAKAAVQQANQATGGAVPTSVQNLTACIAAAGTDTGKIQACDAKFK